MTRNAMTRNAITRNAEMTSPNRLPAATASAVLIDVSVIGEYEARRRVTGHWQPASKLFLVLGHWMLTLPVPVRNRSAHVIGQPLGSDSDGLVSAGLRGSPGSVTFEHAGQQRRFALTELEEVSRADWIELTDLEIHDLTPIQRQPVAVHLDVPDTPVLDLRASAGVGNSRPGWYTRRPWQMLLRRRVVIPLVFVALGLVFAFVILPHVNRRPSAHRAVHPSAGASSSPTPTPVTPEPAPHETASGGPALTTLTDVPPGQGPVVVPASLFDAGSRTDAGSDWSFLGPILLATVALGAFGLSRRLRAGSGAARRATAPDTGGAVARLVHYWAQRRGQVKGRQRRYLQKLAGDFERGNWDSALRSAISLSSGGSALSLRMPRRRESLELGQTGAGRATAGFVFVHQFLFDMYLDALKRLESSGRIDEAAFLQAEILNDVRGAVSLLERNERIRTAAQLAETRQLEPDLCVHLWFRAGERDRAIGLARTRGAFAAAVDRLHGVDDSAARLLRADWIRSAQLAGDHQEAVRAAWPEPDLRHLVEPDLETGAADAGRRAGWFLAHLAALRGAEVVPRMLELLDPAGAVGLPHRDVAVTAIAETRSADPAVDRQLSTAALRTVLHDGNPFQSRRARSGLVDELRQRADPVFAADLPHPLPSRGDLSSGPVSVDLGNDPGERLVRDAVVLDDGRLLIAHGEGGASLVSRSGRTVAVLDRRVDRLVVADHGRTAILVGVVGLTLELSVVSLESLRLTELTRLTNTWTADSYDGTTLPIVEERGILFMDVIDERRRVSWRELDENSAVLSLNRTPSQLTAFVSTSRVVDRSGTTEPVLELWSWDLPGITLRARSWITVDPDARHVAVTGDGLLVVSGQDNRPSRLTRYGRGRKGPELTALAPDTQLMHSNTVHGVLEKWEEGQRLTVRSSNRVIATATFPAGIDPVLHHHADVTTIATANGQVIGIDDATGSVVLQHSTVRLG